MVRIPKFLIILFYLVLSISNKSTKWEKKVGKIGKYLIFNLYFILTIKICNYYSDFIIGQTDSHKSVSIESTKLPCYI